MNMVHTEPRPRTPAARREARRQAIVDEALALVTEGGFEALTLQRLAGRLGFHRRGVEWVRFSIHPVQRSGKDMVEAEAKVLEHRSVRSSSGKATMRPVIVTRVELLGMVWPVELTLANRDAMGFRMLLGREAIRHRFLVDPGKSYYGGKPRRMKSRKDKR